MSHSTIEEIGYYYPQLCCGNCSNFYKNMYEDGHCKLLPYEAIIQAGGCCNVHSNSVDVDDQLVPVDEEEQIQSCTTCDNSYEDNGIPKCNIDNEPLTNVEGWCEAYKKE